MSECKAPHLEVDVLQDHLVELVLRVSPLKSDLQDGPPSFPSTLDEMASVLI